MRPLAPFRSEYNREGPVPKGAWNRRDEAVGECRDGERDLGSF